MANIKGHASDRARSLYALAHWDADHIVLAVLFEKVVVTGEVANWTFDTLITAHIYWSDHILDGFIATLAAVAYALDFVLDSWCKGFNIVAILAVVRCIIAALTHLIQLVEAIPCSLQAVTDASSAHPHFVDDVVWVRVWAKIPINQPYFDKWLGLPAFAQYFNGYRV